MKNSFPNNNKEAAITISNKMKMTNWICDKLSILLFSRVATNNKEKAINKDNNYFKKQVPSK